ncbi:MAG TPA: hypothetical protein VGD37_17010 [Kofleriaceae bacterium]
MAAAAGDVSRRLAAIASIALIGAALEPLVRAPDDDGFPLSTYPMFGAPRTTTLTMARAEGATSGGAPRRLSPAHLGTAEVMQAFTTLQRAVVADPAERAALCAAIAARVAGDADQRDVAEVRIVFGTHDAVALLEGGPPGPSDEEILARCDVPRGRR